MHLYEGTLSEWSMGKWYEHVRRRRMAWWENNKNKEQEYFTFPLQKNVKIHLYFDSILCHLIYCDHFEERERQFLNAYLKKGDIFVDVGANIGLYSLIASSYVGKSGKVFAFEPCAKTYKRLVSNIGLNRMNNVHCVQMALSDRGGKMQMNSSLDGYDAWNSIAPPYAGSAFFTEAVNTVTWDDFVHEKHLEGVVTMMKIDVEGWESHVLSGGTEILSRQDAPVLQVEFTDQASQAAGSSCQAIYRQLEGFGFKMFTYDEKQKRMIPDSLRDVYPYLNLFAIKDLEQVQQRLKEV